MLKQRQHFAPNLNVFALQEMPVNIVSAEAKDTSGATRSKSQPKRENLVFYPPNAMTSQAAAEAAKKANLFDRQNEMASQRQVPPRPLTRTRT